MNPKYLPSAEADTRRENNFTYHAPHGDQAERYGEIRSQIKSLAEFLEEQCPPSRELSVAMTNLEQVMFWANAAIARNEKQS